MEMVKEIAVKLSEENKGVLSKALTITDQLLSYIDGEYTSYIDLERDGEAEEGTLKVVGDLLEFLIESGTLRVI